MSRLVFNRNNGSADEYGHLLALNRLLSGDVIEGLQVQANGSANMTVVVGQGSARISTGTYPSSYGYFVGIDTTTGTPAGESVTITTAPASNSRIDTIVAYVDLGVTASSATANNPGMLKLAAVAGTAASSPTAPSNGTIQSAIGASNPFIKLANVTVGTSVTQITSGNIADLRTLAGVTRLPAANKTTDANGWTIYDYGGWKEYRKRLTASLVLAAGASGTISLSSSTLPTGMANLANAFIEGQCAIAGTAYAFDWNFEMTTSSTALVVTGYNHAGGTLNQPAFFDVTVTSA